MPGRTMTIRRKEKMTLMELTNDMRELLDFGCDPDEEEAFLQTLEPIVEAIDEKADSYCNVMALMEGREAVIDTEIKRLTALKKHIKASRERMESTLLYCLTATDRKEIQTDLHKIKVVKNGGKQPMEITGEVPDSFKRIVYEDDKDKIREALENGETLEFAHLKERGAHLSIK